MRIFLSVLVCISSDLRNFFFLYWSPLFDFLNRIKSFRLWIKTKKTAKRTARICRCSWSRSNTEGFNWPQSRVCCYRRSAGTLPVASSASSSIQLNSQKNKIHLKVISLLESASYFFSTGPLSQPFMLAILLQAEVNYYKKNKDAYKQLIHQY